jgi:hypothetical protein
LTAAIPSIDVGRFLYEFYVEVRIVVLLYFHMHKHTPYTITAELQPIGDLDKGKKYPVTITKEVEDKVGNKMDYLTFRKEL